ncbi:MAG: DRTGG domain-containing protein [Chloroflexi bacterium]|nr:DRTGG domain-containing protein [Chloroflexota bacterium]
MTLILVAGIAPAAGASTVAVGLAHRLAFAGHPVRIERLAGDVRAADDAAVFATLEFAESTGAPLEAPPADVAGTITVIEAPAGADAAGIAERAGARLVFVGPEGTTAPAGATLIVNHAARTGLRVLGEDRLLAAPTVRQIIAASGAQVLSRSEAGEAAVCEHLVIGAISHDSADAYFSRFPRRAVIARAEKVDLALAAMQTRSECLILTGGHEPSPYVLDRAASTRETTLLLAPGGTVETMRDLEGTFGAASFSGEAKVERAGGLMRLAVDEATLAALIA